MPFSPSSVPPGNGVQPFGVVSLLHCDQHVRLDGQHGEDHEGPGFERQLHHGLHGCQEAPRDQPRPPHRRDSEAEGRGRQERQVGEGPGDPAVWDCIAVLWVHPGWPPDTLKSHLQDDQTRLRWDLRTSFITLIFQPKRIKPLSYISFISCFYSKVAETLSFVKPLHFQLFSLPWLLLFSVLFLSRHSFGLSP